MQVEMAQPEEFEEVAKAPVPGLDEAMEGEVRAFFMFCPSAPLGTCAFGKPRYF